jgi:hypothetical protein
LLHKHQTEAMATRPSKKTKDLQSALHSKEHEFQEAREQERPHDELMSIYKELKDLRQQVDLTKPALKKIITANAQTAVSRNDG